MGGMGTLCCIKWYGRKVLFASLTVLQEQSRNTTIYGRIAESATILYINHNSIINRHRNSSLRPNGYFLIKATSNTHYQT
jgi:hypothetical protein